jgi:predicted  nucleic acid-binding Zn-ribbon protein
MMTLYDIEQRAQMLRARIDDLAKEISKAENDSKLAVELLEEMMTLSREAKVINYSLEHFREMAERLITSPCSGPH